MCSFERFEKILSSNQSKNQTFRASIESPCIQVEAATRITMVRQPMGAAIPGSRAHKAHPQVPPQDKTANHIPDHRSLHHRLKVDINGQMLHRPRRLISRADMNVQVLLRQHLQWQETQEMAVS